MSDATVDNCALRRLASLEGIVQRQHLRIECVSKQANEESLVLRQLLDEQNIIGMEAFLARLHRHRFDASRQTSQFTSTCVLDDVASMSEPGLPY